MRNTVMRKFSLVSFLMFLVLAVGLSVGVSGLIKSQVLSVLAHVTGEYIQGLIHSQLRVENVSEEHHDELAQLFQQGVLGEKIMETRIWDDEGRIIFSNDQSLIGQQYALSPSLKKALAGEMLTELAKPQRGKKSQDQMELMSSLKVFGPIKSTQGNILGAYEIYWDDDLLKQAASRAYYLVNIFLIGSFVVLYLILYRYFKTASDTIDEQNTSLTILEKRLEATRQERENTYVGTIRALLATLNARDQYTAGHSVRVADYAIQIGREMGFSEERLKIIEEAALFHDIGKIGIPEHILNKPGKLSAKEFEEIKKHPAIGAQIIGAMEKMLKHSLILLHHHERYDGAGYPVGLAGEAIPLESRILAVADTFDALTSERPYHRALSLARASEVLNDCKGTQLDPLAVDTFLAVVAKEKIVTRRVIA